MLGDVLREKEGHSAVLPAPLPPSARQTCAAMDCAVTLCAACESAGCVRCHFPSFLCLLCFSPFCSANAMFASAEASEEEESRKEEK